MGEIYECEECGVQLTEDEFQTHDGFCVCCWEGGGEHYSDLDDDRYLIDDVGFANPGSALRAETEDNPRNLPCPTCGRPGLLTPLDSMHDYQCDYCADAVERGDDLYA